MSKNTKNPKKISSSLSGISGEYFVAAELSRRGYAASISLRNTSGIDILAAKENLKCPITIQVKTKQTIIKSKPYWILHHNRKRKKTDANSHFFIFVLLKELEQHPVFYIVPSKDVEKYTEKRHKEFVNELGENGQKRKNTSMRIFEDKEKKYLNAWNLLKVK